MKCKRITGTAAVLLSIGLLLISVGSAGAAALIDTDYGNRGTARIDVRKDAVVADIAATDDGAVIATGQFAGRHGAGTIFLVRILPDGHIDRSFGSKGVAAIAGPGGEVSDVLLQDDGMIVIVGNIGRSDGTSDLLVARFTPGGLPDREFGDAGKAVFDIGENDRLFKAALQADGGIVAVGTVEGSGRTAVVVRFTASGRPDTSFGEKAFASYVFPQPKSFSISPPEDIEVLPDGSLLIGGNWDFPVANRKMVGSYLVYFSKTGALIGPDATTYRSRLAGECDSGFDGKVLADGRYISVGRQGGITPYQSGERIEILGGGNILVSGGCLGGTLKLYSADGSVLIGVDREIDARATAALPGGAVAVLTGDRGIIRIKGFTSQGTRQVGFSDDNRADLAVYRPATRTVFSYDGKGGVFARTLETDAASIIPETAEFHTSLQGLVRNAVLYWGAGDNAAGTISYSVNVASGATFFSQDLGAPDDIPYSGDFNGDGVIDVGLFRASEGKWYPRTHLAFTGIGEPIEFGAAGDKPVPADYDFDGVTDYAVFRPSTGDWIIKESSGRRTRTLRFGLATDIPLTGDFDADGKADLTVFRPGEGIWYQLLTSEGFRATRFGLGTDIPVPGDYDGDGRTDIAVYRTGTWYLLQSRDGFAALRWGAETDLPVTTRSGR